MELKAEHWGTGLGDGAGEGRGQLRHFRADEEECCRRTGFPLSRGSLPKNATEETIVQEIAKLHDKLAVYSCWSNCPSLAMPGSRW